MPLVWKPVSAAECHRVVRPRRLWQNSCGWSRQSWGWHEKAADQVYSGVVHCRGSALVGGEILLGLVLDLGLTVSRIWAIAIIVLTCAFSLWKCPRE